MIYIWRPLSILRLKFLSPVHPWLWTSNFKQSPLSRWYRACERTKSKQNQNQVTPYPNWPRVLLFYLVHKHSNDIKASESKGRFLVNGMFGSAWCLVMSQIQFSLIKKKRKIGSPEHWLPLTPIRPITSNFCLTIQPPLKMSIIFVSPLVINAIYWYQVIRISTCASK